MKIYKLLIGFLVLFFLFSCEDETILGPDIEGIGAEPMPTTSFSASRDQVDFKTGEEVHFNLTFEQPTRWLITLTGRNSGATFSIESVSKEINSGNSTWQGASTNAFFQVEEVVATVSFPSFPDEPTLSDTFSISDIVIPNIERVLYSDFTVAPIYNFGNPEPPGGGWGSDFPITTNARMDFPLFDGAYLYFEGQLRPGQGPFVDILQLPSNLGDTLTGATLPLYTNPDRVYLNLAVYNTGTELTWFRVEFKEGDAVNGATRYVDIRPDWNGWKVISVKYSDLVSTNTTPYRPETVVLTNLLLFTDQDESATTPEKVSVAVDQLIFSFDSPLGTTTF